MHMGYDAFFQVVCLIIGYTFLSSESVLVVSCASIIVACTLAIIYSTYLFLGCINMVKAPERIITSLKVAVRIFTGLQFIAAFVLLISLPIGLANV